MHEDPQSWNAYCYSRNNPLKYVDPDGLTVRADEDTGGGGSRGWQEGNRLTGPVMSREVGNRSVLGLCVHIQEPERDSDPFVENNICERALKKAILNRKNALFYRTQNGARVGDLFMSLIHTAELSGANPFDYLTQLLRHADDLVRAPSDWLPWSYRATSLRPEHRP